MKNKTILELLKSELQNNQLLLNNVIRLLELKQLNKTNYDLYNLLDDTFQYINFTNLLFDIYKIIKKRLNDVVDIETILKAIDILINAEAMKEL